MAKPIFTVALPLSIESSQAHELSSSLTRMLNDEYHILVYKASNVTDITFNVFNAINAEDIDLEQIKRDLDLILNSEK